MASLTTKELSGIEDQLGAEELLVKKFQSYAQQAQDQQIKSQAEQMAKRHKQHFDTLMGFLY
ncbi:MAG: spore coat protein [Oscillospiraceae bacterium]|jgi:hypothetical protein|nr:spore coat protein [Oscillospiraceae bacterium]